MENFKKEMVHNSINENLSNIIHWFEIATEKQINRDSEDWIILEKKIMKFLIKNSN